MLRSIHNFSFQILPATASYQKLNTSRGFTIRLLPKPYKKWILPLKSSPSVTAYAEDVASRIGNQGEWSEFDFVEETTSFDFDGSVGLSDLKKLESPTVEVKELEELPEQWRRTKLAWLCKELPAHRSGTFIRILNAQRKWIRQDDCTYIAVHCMRIRENESAFRVYKWMMKQHWYRFDYALATKLADFVGKERKHLKCREIFDTIVNQGKIPCESTYHILIVAYLSSSGADCLDKACEVYNQMIHLGGYKPRLSLHNALFRALVSGTGESSKRHLRQAEFIFHNLETSGLKVHKDIYGGLIWLHSYQDVIDKERIVSLRAGLRSVGVKESTEALVSVLRASSKAGDVTEAEKTWKSILSSGNKPPSQAVLYMMEVYSRIGEPVKSLEIFRSMQEQGLSNLVWYCKIIEILCKGQKTVLAESVMNELVNSGMKPLMCSFMDMMDMYAKLQMHDKIESTFFQCLAKGTPNQTLYNMYLESLVASKNLERAESIFCRMNADEAISINAKSCNTILAGYLNCGNNAKAKKIYEFMCQKKYEIESPVMEKLENLLNVRDNNEAMEPVNPKLSKDQREILIGLLLGGVSFQGDEEKKTYAIDFMFRDDSKIHSSLKKHIYNQFHEWIAFRMLVDDNNSIPSHFSTIFHSHYKFYAEQFWPMQVPAIPKLIHRWLTPRSLAYWYMYGGYRTSSGDILLRLRFPEDDVARMTKLLKAKSLNCLVKRKGGVFWLGFLGTHAAEFWKVVEPFVIADLKESLAAQPEGISEIKHTNFSTSNSDKDTEILAL